MANQEFYYLGILLGACLGALLAALQKDQAAALVGIAWGLGIGAVTGPLLLLLLIGTLNSLPHTPGNDPENCIDVTFRS